MKRNSQGDNFPTMKTLTETQFPPIIDDVNGDGSLVYKGWAELGTATSEPFWKIFRVQKTSTVTTTTAANGTVEYTNIWDDRATLEYSR